MSLKMIAVVERIEGLQLMVDDGVYAMASIFILSAASTRNNYLQFRRPPWLSRIPTINEVVEIEEEGMGWSRLQLLSALCVVNLLVDICGHEQGGIN